MKQCTVKLSDSEALVLQQVYENGEDTTRELALTLGMPRERIVAITAHLIEKGLIGIDKSYGGIWVYVTRRGREVMRYVWPEAKSPSMAV